MKQAVKEWNVTFNSVSDMISIHDENFTITRANKPFANFFNCTPEECIGQKCYKLLHGTNKMHSLCPCKQVQSTKKPASVKFLNLILVENSRYLHTLFLMMKENFQVQSI